jgi:type IV pilus assembly protein PilQ
MKLKLNRGLLVLGIAGFLLVPVTSAQAPVATATVMPAATAPAPDSAAANGIVSFNVTQQAGNVVLRITMKDPLTAPPAGFSVASPARIALDFPNTTNALGRTSQDVNEGDLRSVNLVQVGDRTRMVLNLRRPLAFDSQIDGRNLVITLTGARSGAEAATVAHFAEAKPGDVQHAIRDIDFRRGKGGEGRVIVELTDNNTGVDIKQQGQNIVVEFVKATLPDALRRRLDVVDFATPVQSVNAFTQGENVRLVIEPKGLWEQTAYQTDNQFVLEVKPIIEDPNKLVQGSRGGYQGEKLSLNFQNVEVRAVLQVIADFTNLNIITSDTVGGNLTLRLKDVPWDQALDIILQTKGLDMRKNGNVVWIAPRDELATKEKIDLESKQQISDLEQTRTESFQLNYQKAADVQKILSDPTQRILSKRGSAVIDVRTNTLFVQDVPTRLEEVRRLVTKIDVPVPQVIIEARIVEANDDFSRNLGARVGINDYGNHKVFGQNGLRAGIGGGLEQTVARSGQSSGPGPTGTSPSFISTSTQQTSLNNATNVNLPAQSINGAQPGALSLVLFNSIATQFLNMEISALDADNKGKIISSPRVVTADKVEALIEQGTELPYAQATSSGATSISFRKANLSLKVKPQITPDGNIIMDLDINKDSVGQTTAAGFAIDTKHVKTSVLVENGGTVVIGGIYLSQETTTITKIPYLGDIPYLGNLFKNTQKTLNKDELLIFITPRIMSDRLSVR